MTYFSRRLQFEQKASSDLLHSLLARSSKDMVSDRRGMIVEENFQSSRMPRNDIPAGNFDDISEYDASQLPAYSNQRQVPSMQTTKIQRSYFIWVGLGWYRYQYRSRSKFSRPKHTTYNRKTKSSDLDECIERLFIPFAFTGLQGFSLRGTPSCSSWQYTFTPVRVVPVDSPVFAICASGNLKSLTEHFQEGGATLFDTSPDGWTLLHVCLDFNPFRCGLHDGSLDFDLAL